MKVNQLRVGTLLSYVNLAIGSIIPMIYTLSLIHILSALKLMNILIPVLALEQRKTVLQ